MKSKDYMTILLADDNPDDIYLAQEAFKMSSIPVDIHVVNDGIDVLAFLNKQGQYNDAPLPDIVLLDLNMPGMQGLEVLARIKCNPNLKSLAVIILSTSNNEDDISNSLKSEASAYITKPMEFKRYLDLVKQVEDFWRNLD